MNTANIVVYENCLPRVSLLTQSICIKVFGRNIVHLNEGYFLSQAPSICEMKALANIDVGYFDLFLISTRTKIRFVRNILM